MPTELVKRMTVIVPQTLWDRYTTIADQFPSFNAYILALLEADLLPEKPLDTPKAER